MPAITIYDNRDEIPEDLRESATELEGGKFQLPAEKLLTKNAELLAEKKRVADEVKRLRAEAEKFKDLDPERARKALKDLEDAEAEKLRTQGDWNARESALKQGFEAEKAPLLTTISEHEKALDKLVIENEIARVAVLPDIKLANPRLLHMAVSSLIRRNGMDYEILDKPDGTVRYGTDGKPLRMEAFLKELREDAELSRLFDATGASGSGAPANTGGAGGKIDKTLKRSSMSDKAKQDFIREHGYAKYKELPE